jgi:NADPH:quinone reductase-like Zn-dependent oxidoreductase
MKAIVYDRKGTKMFELRELEKPVPKQGEVLLRVRACSISAADYRSLKLGIPAKQGVYGADVAGTAVSVGEGVNRLAIGDDVMGDLASSDFGGFAEYAVAPEAILAKKPAELSFEAAATIALSGVTALQAVRLGGDIHPGQRVLILGAGGGVGTYAVQLAKYFGAEVTAVCGTRNVEQARSLGADMVLDYTRVDCLNDGSRYDRILAINGKRALRDYYRALKPGGIAIVVGGALSQVLAAMAFGFLYADGGRRICILAAKANADSSAFVAELIRQGRITPVIERIVSLEETGEAFSYVAAGHARGKVVVRMP